MDQLKFYKYCTAGLLILNIAALAFFFFSKPPPPPQDGGFGRQSAAQIMDLDEQQHDLFQKNAADHMQLMDKLNHEQKQLLLQYFASLNSGDAKLPEDSLIPGVLQLEKDKIESVYLHLAEIKTSLKPEQLAGYQSFVDDALRRILLIDKKSSGPPKDF